MAKKEIKPATYTEMLSQIQEWLGELTPNGIQMMKSDIEKEFERLQDDEDRRYDRDVGVYGE